MKRFFTVALFLAFCLQLVVAQETRYFKYSHSVNMNSEEVQNKYSKSSSKYFYITCVDGDKFAEVHGSWYDAQTYANRYQRSSSFSSRFVQMTNMTDLFTGQPYILSEKYELYEIKSGYEIYPRQFQQINAWGYSSGWSYSENFYALGDCCLIVREKGKDATLHYYYELDMNEVKELVDLARKYDPYNFDNIQLAPSSSSYDYNYGSTSSSSLSSYTASTREERMYKQLYAKRVSQFHSTKRSLDIVETYTAKSSIRTVLYRIQNEMRNLRVEAQQKGIYIEQAYEEYASF